MKSIFDYLTETDNPFNVSPYNRKNYDNNTIIFSDDDVFEIKKNNPMILELKPVNKVKYPGLYFEIRKDGWTNLVATARVELGGIIQPMLRDFKHPSYIRVKRGLAKMYYDPSYDNVIISPEDKSFGDVIVDVVRIGDSYKAIVTKPNESSTEFNL